MKREGESICGSCHDLNNSAQFLQELVFVSLGTIQAKCVVAKNSTYKLSLYYVQFSFQYCVYCNSGNFRVLLMFNFRCILLFAMEKETSK